MFDRYARAMSDLQAAVLESPGELDPAVRRAIATRVALRSGAAQRAAEPLPTPLADYVEKVGTRAFDMKDEDVEALRRAGYSEEAVFEATVAAALGAGLARLRRARAASAMESRT